MDPESDNISKRHRQCRWRSSLAKNPFGLFRQYFAACCAHNLSAVADKFHTCSLKGVFAHVHAAVENDFNYVFRFRGKFCEAILTV